MAGEKGTMHYKETLGARQPRQYTVREMRGTADNGHHALWATLVLHETHHLVGE